MKMPEPATKMPSQPLLSHGSPLAKLDSVYFGLDPDFGQISLYGCDTVIEIPDSMDDFGFKSVGITSLGQQAALALAGSYLRGTRSCEITVLAGIGNW